MTALPCWSVKSGEQIVGHVVYIKAWHLPRFVVLPVLQYHDHMQ